MSQAGLRPRPAPLRNLREEQHIIFPARQHKINGDEQLVSFVRRDAELVKRIPMCQNLRERDDARSCEDEQHTRRLEGRALGHEAGHA